MSKFHAAVGLLSVLLLSTLILAGEQNPASESLLGGKVEFAPPAADEWERAHTTGAGDVAAYMNKEHKGMIALQVLPADAEISPQMGGAIIRQLRQNHKQAGQKIVMDPKVERDPRFDLRVHEKFRQDDKTVDQLHLYRNLGPRVVMLTAQAQADSDEQSKPIFKAGETLALSARWVKPAHK